MHPKINKLHIITSDIEQYLPPALQRKLVIGFLYWLFILIFLLLKIAIDEVKICN